VFSETYPALLEQIQNSNADFGFKLISVAKKLKAKQTGRIDKDLLIEKVTHQLIEHLDDTRITSCNDFVQIAQFLEANGDVVPTQELHRLANGIMSELERRGYMLQSDEIEKIG
jgi:hypothetical protein